MEISNPAEHYTGIRLAAARVAASRESVDIEEARTGALTTSAGEEWMSLLDGSQRFPAGRLLYCLVFKRWFDLPVACVLLPLLVPVFLAVALAIRLEGRMTGVLFRQTRIGRNGRPFTVYKFQTMIPEQRTDGDFPTVHKVRNDPRITRVGHFLRRTSLDELPQLINVVRGEMSLVGPRPELPQIVARYEPWQHERHLVRPGMTGWWQVNGRSERPMHENTELDIYYVVNQSFRLDLEILLRTIGVVTRMSGAF